MMSEQGSALIGGTACADWLKRHLPEHTWDDVVPNTRVDDQLLVEGLLSVFCGQCDFVHGGGYRGVYAPVSLPDVVIKVEKDVSTRQNILEYESWQFISKYPDLAKFYAPVLGLSDNGRVLVQRRATRLLATCDLCRDDFKQLSVPAGFVTDDCKMSNFGVHIADGVAQIWALDYGFTDTLGYARAPMVPWGMFASYLQPRGAYIARNAAMHERWDSTNNSVGTASNPNDVLDMLPPTVAEHVRARVPNDNPPIKAADCMTPRERDWVQRVNDKKSVENKTAKSKKSVAWCRSG